MKLAQIGGLVLLLGLVYVAGRCGRPEPALVFSTKVLDSTRTVTESIRVVVRKTDTLTVERVTAFLDSLPHVIQSVDSTQCSPVIARLRDCGAKLAAVSRARDAWKGLALRDSAQVVAERMHSDSILTAYQKRLRRSSFGCTAGIAAGYDPFGQQGYTGVGVTCGIRL